MSSESELSNCEFSEATELKKSADVLFLCNMCNVSFKKRSRLFYHLRCHTGERPFVCDVEGCDKSYTQNMHLQRHKRLSHQPTTTEYILCPIEGCPRELANKYSLQIHILRKHNPERDYPFKCADCPAGFFKKRKLIEHSFVHTNVLPYECEKCKLRFPNQRDLSRHKRTHTEYACKCEKVFERFADLRKHKKVCASIKFQCHICLKEFKRRTTYKAHMNCHKPDPAIFNCSYEGCSRTYLSKSNLMYHIKVNHKQIPVKRVACTHPGCDRTFSKMQNLKHHVELIHSGIKKEKRPRKPRKDKGIPKICMASVLTGIQLPHKVHGEVIGGKQIKPPSEITQPSGAEHLTLKRDEENEEVATQIQAVFLPERRTLVRREIEITFPKETPCEENVDCSSEIMNQPIHAENIQIERNENVETPDDENPSDVDTLNTEEKCMNLCFIKVESPDENDVEGSEAC